MRIKSFVFNSNQVNPYILPDESSKETLVVDCGCSNQFEFDRLKSYITAERLCLRRSICTHLHFVHIFGNNYLFQNYNLQTKASIYDEYLLEWNRMCSMFMPLTTEEKELLKISNIKWLTEPYAGIKIEDIAFSILPTPGHSPGSISFYTKEKNVIFSGDVVFTSGEGRTDFDGGDSEMLNNSLRLIAKLPPETIIFPGHYEAFKIKDRFEK